MKKIQIDFRHFGKRFSSFNLISKASFSSLNSDGGSRATKSLSDDYSMERFLLKTGDEDPVEMDENSEIADIQASLAIKPAIDRYWMQNPLAYRSLRLSKDYFDGLEQLQRDLKISFDTRLLLLQSFVHSSAAELLHQEAKIPLNEALQLTNDRLIPIGKQIFNFSTCHSLLQINPQFKSKLIQELSGRISSDILLSSVSQELKLSKHLVLHADTLMQHKYETDSDVLMALLGAIYLDKGMKQVFKFIFSTLTPLTDKKLQNFIKNHQ